ncbi:Uncharacterised protein [Klebsiella aerogenes]|nr:Uncharacterised protein [Klebsiella aerogenes]
MTEALQVMILTSGKRLLDHRDVKGLKRHQQAFQIHSRPGFIGIDNERRTRGRRTNRRHFFQNRIAVKLDFEQDGTPRDGIRRRQRHVFQRIEAEGFRRDDRAWRRACTLLPERLTGPCGVKSPQCAVQHIARGTGGQTVLQIIAAQACFHVSTYRLKLGLNAVWRFIVARRWCTFALPNKAVLLKRDADNRHGGTHTARDSKRSRQRQFHHVDLHLSHLSPAPEAARRCHRYQNAPDRLPVNRIRHRFQHNRRARLLPCSLRC